MGLETGDFIADLDPNNPLGGDPKSEGDDHIRLTKRCVQGSFPAFVGTTASPASVVKTEAELNDTAEKSANETISGSWVYSENTRWINGKGIQMTASDATEFLACFMSGSDILRMGTSLYPVQTDASLRNVMLVDSVEVARFRPSSEGSLTVQDRVGGSRKAGFRNPSRVDVNANRAVSQNDEGRILQVGGSTTNMSLVALEDDTTFRVVNSRSLTITLTASGIGLQAYRGSGGPEVASSVTIAGGGVVEVMYPASGTAYVFGHIVGVT